MSSKFIHVVAWQNFLFLRLNNILLYAYTTFHLSIHLLMGTLVASTFWLLPNSAAMNMGVQIFVLVPVVTSFGYVVRSRIVGSYCNSVFNFLSSRHSVFHSSCTILHFYQQSTRVSISPHLLQHLFSFFLSFFLLWHVYSYLQHACGI